jgi:hypothetical protein
MPVGVKTWWSGGSMSWGHLAERNIYPIRQPDGIGRQSLAAGHWPPRRPKGAASQHRARSQQSGCTLAAYERGESTYSSCGLVSAASAVIDRLLFSKCGWLHVRGHGGEIDATNHLLRPPCISSQCFVSLLLSCTFVAAVPMLLLLLASFLLL